MIINGYSSKLSPAQFKENAMNYRKIILITSLFFSLYQINIGAADTSTPASSAPEATNPENQTQAPTPTGATEGQTSSASEDLPIIEDKDEPVMEAPGGKSKALAIAYDNQNNRVWYIDNQGDLWCGSTTDKSKNIKWQNLLKGIKAKDLTLDRKNNRLWMIINKKNIAYATIPSNPSNIKLVRVNGEASSITSGSDGNIWHVGNKNGLYFCDSAINDGQTSIKWIHVYGKAKQIAAGTNFVLHIGGGDNIYYAQKINTDNPMKTKWTNTKAKAKKLFVESDDSIWIIDKNDSLQLIRSIDSAKPTNIKMAMVIEGKKVKSKPKKETKAKETTKTKKEKAPKDATTPTNMPTVGKGEKK